MACAPLPFPNPAPGLEKPFNETRYDLLAGQGFADPVNTRLPVLVSGRSHKEKKRFEMRKAA